VLVCDIKLAVAVATLLRRNLVSIAHERTMSVDKNEKKDGFLLIL